MLLGSGAFAGGNARCGVGLRSIVHAEVWGIALVHLAVSTALLGLLPKRCQYRTAMA